MINVNLKSKPEWFLEMNPLGKVPTIKIKDEIFYESLPVCDYLDEEFPGRKLNPENYAQRTKDRMLLALYDGVSKYQTLKNDELYQIAQLAMAQFLYYHNLQNTKYQNSKLFTTTHKR